MSRLVSIEKLEYIYIYIRNEVNHRVVISGLHWFWPQHGGGDFVKVGHRGTQKKSTNKLNIAPWQRS